MKKLIIQDTDQDLLDTITIMLSDATYEVLPITQYAEVFNKIDMFRPHLVMLDFRPSGEESKAVCLKIKQQFPNLTVIALSCNINIEKEYVKAGFDDYIQKPFDIDHLFSVVNKNSALSNPYQQH